MTHRLLPLSLVTALALLAACAATSPPAESTDADAVVELRPLLRFAPTPLTIRAGDAVEFRNVSPFGHTVSTRPSTPGQAAVTALPEGATSFDSGEIPSGGVFRHTFDVPGTYRYFCAPHQGLGMVGTVVVTAG